MTDEMDKSAEGWLVDFCKSRAVVSAELCGIPLPKVLAAFAASIQAEVEHQKANWEEMHRDCMKAEQQLAEARANRDTWMAEARELQRLKTLWQDETNRSVAEARAQAFKEAAEIARRTIVGLAVGDAVDLIAAAIDRAAEAQRPLISQIADDIRASETRLKEEIS